MPVKEITVNSFRNHEQAEFEFGAGVNVIWGGNGSGKTSVLEAIYLLAYGRSFRTNKILETLRLGQEQMSIGGHFEQSGTEYVIKLNQLKDGRKKFLLNDKQVSGTRDLIGLNPVVVLSPEEQIVTKGAPGDRRAYFDRVFSVVSPDYVETLVSYTRALKQRNAALFLVGAGRAPVSSATAWDETLVKSGQKIWSKRRGFVDEFSQLFIQSALDFTEGKLDVFMKHLPQRLPDADEHQKQLEESLKGDIRRNYTGFGPHRDQYEIGFNGEDLRKFGSQGEHKLTLVLIKMSEALFIRKYSGKEPTILLDDLFAKLDLERSTQVLNALGKNIQTIITGTDLIDLEKRGIDLSGPDDKSYKLGGS